MMRGFDKLFLLLALLLGLASVAQARLTLGVVEDANLLAPREAQLRLLADYLAAELGEDVRIRLFHDPDNLIRWMSRHREIDLAVLHHDQVRRLPAGEVLPVADFQRRGQAGLAVDQLVASQGLNAARRARLQQLLTDMERTPAGRRTLEQLGVERFLAPGSGQPRLAEVRPAPAPPAPPAQVAPRPAPAPQVRRPAPPAAPAPRPQTAPPAVATAEVPVPTPPASAAPAPKSDTPSPRIWAEEVAGEPDAVSATVPTPVAAPAPAPAPVPETVPVQEPAPVQEAAPVAAPAPTPAAPVEVPVGPGDKVIPGWRKALDLLVVLAALGGTFWFFRRRRRQAHQSALAVETRRKAAEKRDADGYLEISGESLADAPPLRAEPRAGRAAKPRGAPPAPAVPITARPQGPIEVASGDFCALNPAQLQGTLDLAGVFSLLRMIADYPRPGTLVVRSPHDEKRIHFRNGHISAAFSLNLANRTQAGFLMNKLGYLLVRMGLVSEQQRDRALDFCHQHPGKRLGEVLVQSGALTEADLKRALRTQAEGVVLSLFLFPQGRFEVAGESLDINLEDDLGIAVQDILKEATRYQEEWDGLRASIPSLDTVIAYDEDGRAKLDTARMTEHQKLILSLVDGRRSLKDICRDATMLDFEVYKFIYLMVRAHILKPVVTP